MNSPGQEQTPRLPASVPETGTLSVAVQQFGISRTALYNLAGAGEITMIKVGTRTLVDFASVRAYLARQPRAVVRGAGRSLENAA